MSAFERRVALRMRIPQLQPRIQAVGQHQSHICPPASARVAWWAQAR